MVKKAVIIAAGRGSRLKGNGADLPKPLVKVAGVELLKRTLLSAKRAGVGEFVVVTGYRGEEIQAAISADSQVDVQIDWVQNEEWERGNGVSVFKAREYVDGPFLLLMSDHLFDPQALAKLRNLPVAQGEAVLCVDSRLDRVFDMEDATKVLLDGDRIAQIGKELANYNAVDTGIFLCSSSLFEALEASIAAGEGSLSGGIRSLAAEGNMRTVDIDGLFWLDVDTPEALVYAEHRLFAMLGKQTDGFVSRNLNRKISTWLTRGLVHTPITPNQISLATMGLSFLAAWMVASAGDYVWLALGGLLFQLTSIVDGCDGEIAKLRFMGSQMGEWIDTLADNVSYLVFFIAVILGMYHATEEPFFMMLGAVMLSLDLLGISLLFLYLKSTGSGSLVSASMAFSNEVPEDQRGWFHRFCTSIKFVARRDFFAAFFCVLALADSIAGMYWFLIIGSGLLCAGIFGYGGHMLRVRDVWPATAAARVETEKLISEKAD